jgi:hypothetical protein
LGHLWSFSAVEEFAQVGHAKVLDLEDRDNVAAVVIPRRSQDPIRRGNDVAIIFRGWFTGFCWGFGKSGCAERGFLMVKLWWIGYIAWFLLPRFWARKICHFSAFIFAGFPFWECGLCLHRERLTTICRVEAEGGGFAAIPEPAVTVILKKSNFNLTN